MRDPEFALEERSIQILTDPYKSILGSGILPLLCAKIGRFFYPPLAALY